MNTSRRDFLKTLAKFAVASAIPNMILPLTGCGYKPREKINVRGTNYLIKNGVLTQDNNKKDEMRLAILADCHAQGSKVKYFIPILESQKVDAHLIAGDLSWSFGDYEGARNDYSEIIDVIEPVASTGNLVLVYPGNHEQTKTYRAALDTLMRKYENVVDMESVPVADLGGLTIAGLGGNDNPRFNVSDGFLRTSQEFQKLAEMARDYQKEKPLLIATHVPKKYSSAKGLDVIDSGRNVGSDYLAGVRKTMGSKFAVSGHIHEAFGIVTPEGNPLASGEFSESLDFNPGAVWDHLGRPLKPAAGILEFKGKRARAVIVNKEGNDS